MNTELVAAEGETAVEREPGRPLGRLLLSLIATYGTLGFLLLLVVGFSVAVPEYFFTVDNARNILDQASLGAIVAGGVTIALVCGEFDLSVGNIASLCGVVVVTLLVHGVPVVVAILVSIGVAAIIGLVNGLIVTKLNVNALIATLGTGSLIVGGNYAVADGVPPALLEPVPGFSRLSQGTLLGLPYTVWIMALVFVGLWVMLNRTALGQELQAVGGNEEAARLAGVPVARRRIIAFALSASCAGLAGVVLASRVGSGQITAGDAYLLPAYAAAFLGSAVLRDGEFHLLGTFVGVLVVAVGNNGLTLLAEPTYIRYLFTGGVLVIAVALSTGARRVARE